MKYKHSLVVQFNNGKFESFGFTRDREIKSIRGAKRILRNRFPDNEKNPKVIRFIVQTS